MDSFMESDYVMQFEVYDAYHDITKTHVIYSKEPDMKPHGCSTKNPSSIRAHVIIMKFLENIREYFKDNKISCRMNDVLDVLFNSAPGILRSPTITLTNYDFNYHANRYQSIQFTLEDKQVYYSESFYILAVIDHDIKPGKEIKYSENIIINNGKGIGTEERLKELMIPCKIADPKVPPKDDNQWDTFLNEKKMERLHKNDDNIKYFCAPLEVLDKIDIKEYDSPVKYTAGTDGDAIQRASVLLAASATKYNLANGRIEISINSAIASYMRFLVIAVIVISHDGNMKKWGICKLK